MANNAISKRKQNMDHLKAALNVDSVKNQFENVLKENAGAFVASIIDLVGSDSTDGGLQDCDPTAVVMQCLKAASLKLPINKQLGFAYIYSFKVKGVPTPVLVPGYKGYIQLALRTGKYKHINADYIYEGMEVTSDYLTGAVAISGEKTSDKAIGYFCHLELLTGFTKTLYMTRKQAEAWGKKYAPAYNNKQSLWQTDFDKAGLKTTVRNLLSRWGIMSVEMEQVFKRDVEGEVAAEIGDNANGKVIDITEAQKAADKKKPELGSQGEKVPTEAEIAAEEEAKEKEAKKKAEPGF